MTVLTVLYAMSSDPIPEKSEHLFAVRLDSWDPDEAYDSDLPEEAPFQLTHKDAMALLESPIPVRHAAMRKAIFTAIPENKDVAPFLTVARMTGGDFFEMFQVPFEYGGNWDKADDRSARNVVVLSKETNDTLFGGENSVGRVVQFGEEQFVVSGVLAHWDPIISYYDVNNGPMSDVEDIFIPYTISNAREIDGTGNTNCWKDEIIDTYFDLIQSECVLTQFWAELDSPKMVAEYHSWLNAYTEGQKKLGRFERPTNNRLSNVTDWLRMREVVSDEEWAILSIAVMFLAACLVNTIGLILARFIAKAPVIGLRRALGASKRVIFRQHLVEVGAVGFVGGLLGIGLAALGLAGIRVLMPYSADTTHLNMELMAFTVLIAVGSAILAGLYPTWRVCQMPPANYLKTQ